MKLYISCLIVFLSFIFVQSDMLGQNNGKQKGKTTVQMQKNITLPDSTVCGGHGKCNGRQNKGFQKAKRDTFIDKDGDGINDSRCRGMGLSNCRKKCKSPKK